MLGRKDDDYAKANSTAALVVMQRLKEQERWTEERCTALGMSREARRAAAAADRWVIRQRIPFVAWRHNEIKRRFLRMFVRLALATDPDLVPKAKEVARYYAANYPFEWIASEITEPAAAEIAETILEAGDSSFGDTSNAPAMAYAQFHHRALGLCNVGKFGDVYAQAASLRHHGEFTNYHDGWRASLGLHTLRPRRDAAMAGQETQVPAETHSE